MLNGTLHVGDVVIAEGGRRARVTGFGDGDLLQVRHHGAIDGITCDAREIRRVDSWWNTAQKRSAFIGPRVVRRRSGLRSTMGAAAAARRAKARRAAAAAGRRTNETGAT